MGVHGVRRRHPGGSHRPRHPRHSRRCLSSSRSGPRQRVDGVPRLVGIGAAGGVPPGAARAPTRDPSSRWLRAPGRRARDSTATGPGQRQARLARAASDRDHAARLPPGGGAAERGGLLTCADRRRGGADRAGLAALHGRARGRRGRGHLRAGLPRLPAPGHGRARGRPGRVPRVPRAGRSRGRAPHRRQRCVAAGDTGPRTRDLRRPGLVLQRWRPGGSGGALAARLATARPAAAGRRAQRARDGQQRLSRAPQARLPANDLAGHARPPSHAGAPRRAARPAHDAPQGLPRRY